MFTKYIDLSLEVVIEVSSEEEQKGEDDDNDDVGNGIAHLQHSVRKPLISHLVFSCV